MMYQLSLQESLDYILKIKELEKAVEFVTDSKLSKFHKSLLRKAWLHENGVNHVEWEKARNRNARYKEVKSKGADHRNFERRMKYNYNSSNHRKKVWTIEEFSLFINMNKNTKDRILAQHFSTTLAGVQGVRRKINMAEKIQEKMPNMSILELTCSSENTLRKRLKELNDGTKKRRSNPR